VRYQRSETTTRPPNGWAAIASEFADQAITFRQWLGTPEAEESVAPVLRRLFLNKGLAAHYHGSSVQPEPEPKRPIEQLKLPDFRRIRVREAANQLAQVLNHVDGANLRDTDRMLEVIEAFAHDGRIGAIPATDTPDGLVLVRAHGDLHTANILILEGEPPQPLVIDLASIRKPHHWAADPARLMIDIALRTLDNSVESFLWRCLNDWRLVIQQASELDASVVGTQENAAVTAALNWFGEERERVLPELFTTDRWWEWHVALAEQLLRGTYQAQLPPAKRTLALVAAYDQLRLAESRIPARRRTF
jgi:hypothetical protein